jgi:hypothetical protein
MKINLIPTKKLAVLSAAFCAVMLAFSQNARAVTTDLNIGDPHYLGFIETTPSDPPDDFKTGVVNLLISMAPNTQAFFFNRAVFRANNDFGPLPGPAVIGPSGTTTNITIGSGIYSYLYAQYNNDVTLSSEGDVWYIGNLSGDITIPSSFGGHNILAGWTLFGPGVPGVPDGGTTVMLLGAALGALGMARRFLKA